MNKTNRTGLSTLTAGLPAIYKNYGDFLSTNWPNIIAKLTTRDTDSQPEFDHILAEFHLHLTALVYEREDIIRQVIDLWDPDHDIGLSHHRFGYDGCVVNVVYSVKNNFIVMSFKGTSILNLAEWLTDFTMQKSHTKNGLLPGSVHTGFFSALRFSTRSDVEPAEHIDIPPIPEEHPGGIGIWMEPREEAIVRHVAGFAKEGSSGEMLMEVKFHYILDLFQGKHLPHLWITGHSLGAATASIFTSVLLWKRSLLGSNGGAQGLKLDSVFRLHGTFTFGGPRVGDREFRICSWKEAIDKVLTEDEYRPKHQPKYQFWSKNFYPHPRRIINANDIVSALPPTPFGGSLEEKTATSDTPGKRKASAITLNDFHHLGKPILLGYRGRPFKTTERTTKDFFSNLVAEVLATPRILFTRGRFGDKIAALVTVATLGFSGLLRDHILSEYVENLQRSEERMSLLPL
ncbi:hypothetical protein BC936DRAFT_139252 [Jimgerdemannia flammicorona]|uniref:Fungal lipase-type domain-containing protein n=1 Tax=Jimgerdemannia flammicorona TaxID=994334 RepID=A0A433BAA5_9FUNG|nr:hypothetical protein BC936DRAFT_139252 [Jimgerdemannia flammicorona]